MSGMRSYFLQGSLYHFHISFDEAIIVILHKNACLTIFLSYFNTQGENFSSIFDGLSQIQFRKDQLSAWAIVIEYVLLHLIAVIKLSHFCLRTLIFRWPITILPKFFWRISLRLFIFIRERLNVALYSPQLWKL